jgi:indole-3-glycerol phosphate synthase
MDFLEKVAAEKRLEIEKARERASDSDLEMRLESAQKPRGFRRSLLGKQAVIAEIKRASPSAGLINRDLDPGAIARLYEKAGASAVSVLTDLKHFSGTLADLELARSACRLPLLRKDFIIDRYQMLEAVLHGADAVLLITALLAESLQEKLSESAALGLDALVEVHTGDELSLAVQAGANLIGVNNRDLRTLEVDLGVTERLASLKPRGVILVAASGVSSPEDARRMFNAGADAILAGTILASSPDPASVLKSFLSA